MMSTRTFVVLVNVGQAGEFMGMLGEFCDTGVVADWGIVVPVSRADGEADAITDDDNAAMETSGS